METFSFFSSQGTPPIIEVISLFILGTTRKAIEHPIDVHSTPKCLRDMRIQEIETTWIN
jgi:hypothetical protein